MDIHAPGDEQPGNPGTQSPPPPSPTAEPGPDPQNRTGFFGAVRALDVQRADDRWVGGVCAGLANRTGLDPLLFRGIFAASILLGGLGLVVYGAAWALLPERRDGRIHLEELLAGRFDVAVLGAAAFAILGLGRGGDAFGFWGNGPHWFGWIGNAIAGLLWVAFVAAVIVAIVVALSRRNAGHPPTPQGPYGPYPKQPPAAQPSASHAQQGQAQQSQAQHGQAQPGQAQHGQALHGLSHQGHGYAGQTYPSQTYPSQTYPSQTYPSQTSPSQGYTSQTHASQTYPSQTYPSQTYTPQPYQYTPRPPQPPKPPRPRTLGPGSAAVGIVVALSLLTAAVLMAAERTGDFDGPVLLTAAGISIAVAGLGIVVSGFRGRSSGVLGFLAIVGILVAVPVGAVGMSDWGWNEEGVHRFAGDVDLSPATRAEAEAGFTLGFGKANVDLTAVPMTSELLEVPVTVGAGDLTIVVPEDAAVTADVRLRAGKFTWDVDDAAEHVDGISTDTRTFTDDASAAGSAQLELRISVGAGDVRVIREDS
jgi:phage shock protein PspC (stress-responsive transcriptional regulator)